MSKLTNDGPQPRASYPRIVCSNQLTQPQPPGFILTLFPAADDTILCHSTNPQVRELFGTAILPTPHRWFPFFDKTRALIAKEIQELNPGQVVCWLECPSCGKQMKGSDSECKVFICPMGHMRTGEELGVQA